MIRQFEQDIYIWSHQRYSDPPALSPDEYEGFTAIRNWAKQFYPDGTGGSAAELYRGSRNAEGHHECPRNPFVSSRSPPATSAQR